MEDAGTIDEDVIFNEFWGTQEVRRKNFIWTELLPDGFFLLQVNEFWKALSSLKLDKLKILRGRSRAE